MMTHGSSGDTLWPFLRAGIGDDVLVGEIAFEGRLAHTKGDEVFHRGKLISHFIRQIDELILHDQGLRLAVIQDIFHLGSSQANMRGTQINPPFAANA